MSRLLHCFDEIETVCFAAFCVFLLHWFIDNDSSIPCKTSPLTHHWWLLFITHCSVFWFLLFQKYLLNAFKIQKTFWKWNYVHEYSKWPEWSSQRTHWTKPQNIAGGPCRHCHLEAMAMHYITTARMPMQPITTESISITKNHQSSFVSWPNWKHK